MQKMSQNCDDSIFAYGSRAEVVVMHAEVCKIDHGACLWCDPLLGCTFSTVLAAEQNLSLITDYCMKCAFAYEQY